MTTTVGANADRISVNPDVCGGEACVRGTRIMVWLLVFHRRRGRPETEILADYPGLTPADLDAAWDYYRNHPAEIEQAIWLNSVAANHPPGTPVTPGMLVDARLLGLTDRPDAEVLAAATASGQVVLTHDRDPEVAEVAKSPLATSALSLHAR